MYFCKNLSVLFFDLLPPLNCIILMRQIVWSFLLILLLCLIAYGSGVWAVCFIKYLRLQSYNCVQFVMYKSIRVQTVSIRVLVGWLVTNC